MRKNENKNKNYFVDQRVIYRGKEFSGDLGGKTGYVVAGVDKDPELLVVEFEGESYIIHEKLLDKHTQTTKDDGQPEVFSRPRRRRDPDVD